MKQDLEALKRKAESNLTDDDAATCSSSKRQDRRLSLGSRIYEQDCIFCGKIKWCKGTSTREKLSKAVDLRADEKLRDIAVRKCDMKIIAATSGDVVAAEALYHFPCYINYRRPSTKDAHEGNTADTNESDNTGTEEEAYDELLAFIHNDIIPNKEIVKMTTLAEHLNSIMISRGLHGIRTATRKNLARKLETDLGDSAYIFNDSGGKLIVVPENLTLQYAVKEIQTLKQQLSI